MEGFKYEVGHKIGNSVVHSHRISDGMKEYVFKCTGCGMTNSYEKEYVESEGMVSHECYSAISRKHRHFFNVWRKMFDRMYDTACKDYLDYGGRGLICDYPCLIKFYNEFIESYKEHVEFHGEKDTTIERIDNDLGYVKGNVKWATKAEQAQNKRNNLNLIATSPEGFCHIVRCAKPFFEENGIRYHVLHDYLSGKGRGQGWSFVKISYDDYKELSSFLHGELALLYKCSEVNLKSLAEREGIPADSDNLCDLLANAALKQKIYDGGYLSRKE
jgi:hypothetical protein